MISIRINFRRTDRLAARARLDIRDREVACISANALARTVRFGVHLDADESALHVTAALGPRLSIRIPLPDRLRERLTKVLVLGLKGADEDDDVDVLEVAVHHGKVWWSVAHTSDQWSSSTPRWRSGSWSPVDAILGPSVYLQRVLERFEDVAIPMPEGSYRWTVEIVERSWKRPRWPWATVRYGYEGEAHEGQSVPIPGKGENSWDCGDDATSGQGGEARSLPEAVAAIVRGALDDRWRRARTLTYPRRSTKTPITIGDPQATP